MKKFLAGFIFAIMLLTFGVRHLPMPSHVDVNGIDWEIQATNGNIQGNPTWIGYTNCSYRRIVIRVDNNNPDARMTLVHEIMHAAVCASADKDFTVNNLYYNSTANDTHEGIYHFSEIFTAIIRRNPRLGLWLVFN